MAPLLLHICCGPCASAVIGHLQDEGHEIYGFFYNPNIHPLGEYLQRRESAGKCAAIKGINLEYDDSWDLEKWLSARLPNSGQPYRCKSCIYERLDIAAARTKELGLEAFSTSLLYSRYQPHEFIRAAGQELAASYGLEFIYRDFRKYWQEGIDLSKEWDLYRQKYCGCVFSETDRYQKKLQSVRKQKFANNSLTK